MRITSFLIITLIACVYGTSSSANTVSMSASVNILANVLFLSSDKAWKICEEDPDFHNCDIIIAEHEEEKHKETSHKHKARHKNKKNGHRQNTVDIDRLQNHQYPVRMVNFE